MSRILISFLGRVPKGENGYRKTRYQFTERLDEPTAFIGWSLCRRLQPDRMVILGTAGSMWDHLFEKDFALGAEAEDERLALQEATDAKKVHEALLAPLAPLLAQRLGCEVRLVLIPYCRTETEQLELLRLMATEVNSGDQVNLDVTHGFRHEYRNGLRGRQEFRSDYAFLNQLRNALAHGVRPKGKKLERTLSDPKLLGGELHRLIKKLLPR